MKDKGGRPSIYSDELAEKICNLIATSDMGIKRLCAEHDWMPTLSTIFAWKRENPQFSQQYYTAKACQAELYADETLEIAREKSYYFDKDGAKKIDSGYVQWQKLNVNTRLWHASKLAPMIYGKDDKSSESDKLAKAVIDKLLTK